MGSTSITVAESPLLGFVLRRADDALILGHRLSEWCGHAPTPEEDLALANIALDLIGLARALYAYAGEAEAAGHDEDAFAYLRDAGQFRNLLAGRAAERGLCPNHRAAVASIRPMPIRSGGR